MRARVIVPFAMNRMFRLTYSVDNDYRSLHYGGWEFVFCTPLFAFAVAFDFYDCVRDCVSSRIDLLVLPKRWSFRIPKHEMLWRKEIIRRSWAHCFWRQVG